MKGIREWRARRYGRRMYHIHTTEQENAAWNMYVSKGWDHRIARKGIFWRTSPYWLLSQCPYPIKPKFKRTLKKVVMKRNEFGGYWISKLPEEDKPIWRGTSECINARKPWVVFSDRKVTAMGISFGQEVIFDGSL